MGQKANLLTLRKIENIINIKEDNPKMLIHILEFLKVFKLFLYEKKILLLKINFISNIQQCTVCLSIFYSTIKCNQYKKLKKDKYFLQYELKNKSFSSLFFNSFNFYNKKLYYFKFLNLNLKIKKPILKHFYFLSKSYLKIVFERRYGLFFDFLKINALYCQGLISVASYLLLLSQIFKFLSKRKHSKFIEFCTKIFEGMLNLPNKYKFTKGMKLIINGKLKGKEKASSSIISFGEVPHQEISKFVDFSVTSSNTRLGSFGLRLWIYRY